MLRAFRLSVLLIVAMVGLSAFQPVVALASPPTAAVAAEHVAQGLSPSRGQPGPIVRQAFDLLMDRFVIPPNSGNVLNGGLDRNLRSNWNNPFLLASYRSYSLPVQSGCKKWW